MKAASRLYLFGKRVLPTESSRDPRWDVFLEELENSGFWTDIQGVDVFVDFRLTGTNVLRIISNRKNQKILIQVEPRSINPFQYSWLCERFFDSLITSRDQSKYSKATLHWTPGYDFRSGQILDSPRPYQVGSLAGNKFSFVQGAQYRKRKATILKLRQQGFDAFMAGRGWSRSAWKSKIIETFELARCIFAGAKVDGDALREYFSGTPSLNPLGSFQSPGDFWGSVECALIIENERGIISEKMFDALSSGCRILYSGKDIESSEYIHNLDLEEEGSEIAFLMSPPPADRGRVLDHSAQILRRSVPSIREGFRELCQVIENRKEAF